MRREPAEHASGATLARIHATRRTLLTLHRVPWRQRDAQIDEDVELAAKGEEVGRFELAGGLPQYHADGDASSDRVERATETDERVQEPREAGKPPGVLPGRPSWDRRR